MDVQGQIDKDKQSNSFPIGPSFGIRNQELVKPCREQIKCFHLDAFSAIVKVNVLSDSINAPRRTSNFSFSCCNCDRNATLLQQGSAKKLEQV